MFSEKSLISAFENALRRRLPGSWAISVTRARRGRQQPDAFVLLRAPDGRSARLAIEAKATVEPRRVRNLLDRFSLWPDANPVVVAPFLSPRAREELTASGAGYADLTGNLRITLEEPALFLETTGASSNPSPEARPLRSLRGSSAARVVRALCDFRPPYGVSALAARAGASVPTVWRVVDFLDREALITREPRGPVTAVDWSGLIRRWTQDYSMAESNRGTTFLESRGLDALLRKLRQSTIAYSVTASLAAATLAPITVPRLATVYVEDALSAAAALRLRAAESGANVLLLEPLDPVVFERTWMNEGVIFSAPSQVAADLLTSPGRGPAEGEELIRWMAENEDAWRD